MVGSFGGDVNQVKFVLISDINSCLKYYVGVDVRRPILVVFFCYEGLLDSILFQDLGQLPEGLLLGEGALGVSEE